MKIFMVVKVDHNDVWRKYPEHPFSSMKKADKYIRHNWSEDNSWGFFIRVVKLDSGDFIKKFLYDKDGKRELYSINDGVSKP